MLQDLLHFAFFALGQEAREKTGLFFFFSDTAIGGIAFAELAGDRSFAWLTSERNFCRLRLLGLQLSYFYIQNFCQRPKEKTKKIWLQYVVAIFSYLTASTKVGHETPSEGLKYKSHVICVYFWIPKFHENVPFSYPLHTVCKMSEYFSYLSYFMTSLTVVFMSFNCFQGFSGRLETSLSSRSVISDLACSSCSVVIWVNFTHCCKEKYSVITHLCNSGTYLSLRYLSHETCTRPWTNAALCKTDNKLSLFRCFIHSPYWSLYISQGVEKENLFDNQELFTSAIISYILKTFTFDSRVTRWGEIRGQKSQGLLWSFP